MQKRIKLFFWLAVGCICLSAAILLLIPAIIPTLKQTSTWVILLGVLFWLSVLSCYGAAVAASVLRRKHGASGARRLPGLFCVLSNRPACYLDIAFAVSAASLLIVMLTKLRTTYCFYLSVAVFWLSLHLHAFFNGQIYRTITAKKKRTRKGDVKNEKREKKYLPQTACVGDGLCHGAGRSADSADQCGNDRTSGCCDDHGRGR